MSDFEGNTVCTTRKISIPP